MKIRIYIGTPTIRVCGKTGYAEARTWNIVGPLIRYLKNRRAYNFDPTHSGRRST
jgi:hypothetical protein